MLDPVTAIGLAGNIVQFVDFSSKIVLTALKIYRSPSGRTQDGLDAKLVADNIASLKNRIESDLLRPLTTSRDQILEVGKQCVEVADELAALFCTRFGRHIKPGILIATKEALRLVWKKEEIENMKRRLASFREQLTLHILVDLRGSITAANLLQSEQYATLDARTKDFAVAVAEQRNVFVDTMKAQLDELKDLHMVTQTSIVDEHGQSRSIFTAQLKANAEINAAEHQQTRVELRDSVILEATILRKEMEVLRVKIQELIQDTIRYPARKAWYSDTLYEKMSLRSKAFNAAWYAKDIRLSELMSKNTADQVDEMTALLGGQTLSKAGDLNARSLIEHRNNIDSSMRNLVLGSNLPFGKTFKIDETLLREGGRKFGFPDHKYDDPTKLPASMQIALSSKFSKQQINDWERDMKLAMNSVEPFFFAGSFIFPSILRLRTNGTSLQGLATSMTPARLRGYHAFVVKDAAWPALSPCGFDEDSTPGMLVFGLRDSQRQSLLDFQGGMFDLRFELVDVEVTQGDALLSIQLKAACFVWNGDPFDLIPLAQAKWSPEIFMRTSFYGRLAGIVHREEKALAEYCLHSNAALGDEGEGDQTHLPRRGIYLPSSMTTPYDKRRMWKRRMLTEGNGEHGPFKIRCSQDRDKEAYCCRGFPEIYPFDREDEPKSPRRMGTF